MAIHVLDSDLPADCIQAALHERIVGVDIETDGLHASKGNRIACVQVHVPTYGTVMVRNLHHPSRLLALLSSYSVTKVFQYAQFDLSFLMRDYCFAPRHICDTKIAADVLDPKNVMFQHPVEDKKSHSLIALVWHYFEDLLDKSIAVSNWFAGELSPEQLVYAEKDVLYLPRLLRKLEMEIFDKDPALINELCRRYRNIPNKAVAMYKGETQQRAA